jgi:hypothetical protein
MPMQDMLAPLQGMQQQGLRVGNNPNPRFPRARDKWQGIKGLDWLSSLKGSLGGAASGATLGSFVPGIGTAIGGGLGALGGGLAGLLSSDQTKKEIGDNLFGQPDEFQQVQNFSSEQQGIMQLLQQLGRFGLQNPYGGFEGIENQARNQFAQQTVPSLAERFTSLGNNSLSSPLFASQLGQAGAGLEGDLASQKAQYGQQNIQQILQMLQLGLQPQFENVHRPQSNGLAQNAILGGIQAAPSLYQSRQISKALDALTKGSKG